MVTDNTEFLNAGLESSLPSNIDCLLPLFYTSLSTLPTRVRNSLVLFLCEHDNSLSSVYRAFNSASFDPSGMKNIGKCSVEQVKQFIVQFKAFLESFSDEHSVDEALSAFVRQNVTELGIPRKDVPVLNELEKEIGHFPLFAAFSAMLKTLERQDRLIVDKGLRLHNGQIVEDRLELAREIGVSSERMRQRRLCLLDSFASFFRKLREMGFFPECPYDVSAKGYDAAINAEEGTDFNINFINFAIASAFDGFSLIGDRVKCFTAFYEKDMFLCLVPSDLMKEFDFPGFIQRMYALRDAKRLFDETVSFKDSVGYKGNPELESDVYGSCRNILGLYFPFAISGDDIVLPSTLRKNNPVIIEEILRENGRPMTLDELYEAFVRKFPERNVAYESFRGNLGKNSHIVPMGRSSTYALAEWPVDEYRGGTIRSFAREYLDSLEVPIAPLSDVGNYVRRFRPTAEDPSISANLLLESKKSFVQYEKDGVKWIGLGSREYDSSFKRIEPTVTDRRPVMDSITLLKSYVTKHYHFPLADPNDPESTRLYKFVDNMRSSYNRGVLKSDESRKWEEFMAEYLLFKMIRRKAEEIDRIVEILRSYLSSASVPNPKTVLDIALKRYVEEFSEEDKEVLFRPYLDYPYVGDVPIGKYILDNLLNS